MATDPAFLVVWVIILVCGWIVDKVKIPSKRKKKKKSKYITGNNSSKTENPYWVPEYIPKGEMRNTIGLRYDTIDQGYDKFDRAVRTVRSDRPLREIMKLIGEMADMNDVRVLNELILIVTDSEHELRKRTKEALEPAMKSLTHQIKFTDRYMRELLVEYIDQKVIYKLINNSGNEEFIPLLMAELQLSNKAYDRWVAEDPERSMTDFATNQYHLKKIISIEDLIETLSPEIEKKE
jgi:hypothetical protein